MWKAQVLAVLRGAQLDGFLDGAIKAPAEKITIKTSMEGGDEEVMNPTFATWKAQEQQVRYLIISVSHDVLVQIAALPSTREVWKHIEMSFASQLRAWLINTHMAVATT
jgi:hypothetical protein